MPKHIHSIDSWVLPARLNSELWDMGTVDSMSPGINSSPVNVRFLCNSIHFMFSLHNKALYSTCVCTVVGGGVNYGMLYMYTTLLVAVIYCQVCV